ncbi:DotG/IcmE/VirB10 family protein [Pseudomonas serbica]|uniref:DotG/IcmE/VirB10 family protein n=1 Tax=Pseudomonas serbica TaxID=2965074 RepID=UPI00237A9AE3|nr:DotG/IcmE/VirB10 family protein [Pseudomonas serbica]
MSAIDNLRKIPVKTRLMIGLAVLSVIVAVGFTVLRLGSSGEQGGSAGGANLNLPPSKEQIGRDKPTEVVRFGENTTVGQLYRKDEEKRAQEAVKGDTSHVDEVRLRLDPPKSAPVVKAEAPKVEEPDQLAKLRQERVQIQQAQDRERQARGGSTPIQENPWKAFVDSERAMTADYDVALATMMGTLKPSRTLPVPNYESSTDATSKASSASGRSSANTGSSSSGTGYEQYLSGNATQSGGGNGKITAQGASQRSLQKGSSRNVDADEVTEEESEVENVPDYPSERIAKAAMKKTTVVGTVPVGSTVYSVLQIGVNTDEISPIRAVTVEKGRLEGAVLTGEPKRVGEKAQLTFTSMSLNGRSYSINAVALDVDTYRSVLADGVDNHTFERYSKLFAAAFVEGYADALSGTQTITNTDGSSSSRKDPLPDTGAQIKVGIGEIGKKMSPIYAKEFDRPPTVTVEPNKSIIIMFMQELDLDKPTQR